jgi:hypothetical protein
MNFHFKPKATRSTIAADAKPAAKNNSATRNPNSFLRGVLLFVLFLMSGSAAWSHDVVGLWHGIGIQGTQSQWSTEIDLTTDSPTVRYPSLKCSGEWQKLTSDNGTFEYREVIKVGRDTCIDGFVRVYVLPNTLLAVEYSENRGGPLIAKAIVFRGPHHERKQQHMIAVTKEFIASPPKQ